MTSKLTDIELAEANMKAKISNTAANNVDNSRNQLVNAVKSNVDQNSDRWNMLCDNLTKAIKSRNAADQDEAAWWNSKGFKV